MVLNGSKFMLSLIPTRSGKTFIIALLAFFFNERCNYSILVVITSSFLDAQLDSELKSYLKGMDYWICYFTLLIK
jgi:hypothetical protein